MALSDKELNEYIELLKKENNNIKIDVDELMSYEARVSLKQIDIINEIFKDVDMNEDDYAYYDVKPEEISLALQELDMPNSEIDIEEIIDQIDCFEIGLKIDGLTNKKEIKDAVQTELIIQIEKIYNDLTIEGF